MLRILLGRARTGKSARVLEEIRALGDSSQPNNPGYRTAGDIVEVRRIKANLVSVNVDKLVREGYLRRETVEGDRRKTLLVCTERAQPVIERRHRRGQI